MASLDTHTHTKYFTIHIHTHTQGHSAGAPLTTPARRPGVEKLGKTPGVRTVPVPGTRG